MGIQSASNVRIDNVVEAVCERLNNRRIGFLWSCEPCDFAPAPGFTWVHYAEGAKGARRYDLNALARPDLEARTLDLLVVPAVSVSVLAELVSGLLITPSSALIDGALRRCRPVLFETSCFLSWYASACEISRKNLLLAIETLRRRGAEFIGYTNASVPEEPARSDTVRIRESGWLSWSEIAPRVRGAGTLILEGGARLTPEARDRLMNLKIRTVEGGP